MCWWSWSNGISSCCKGAIVYWRFMTTVVMARRHRVHMNRHTWQLSWWHGSCGSRSSLWHHITRRRKSHFCSAIQVALTLRNKGCGTNIETWLLVRLNFKRCKKSTHERQNTRRTDDEVAVAVKSERWRMPLGVFVGDLSILFSFAFILTRARNSSLLKPLDTGTGSGIILFWSFSSGDIVMVCSSRFSETTDSAPIPLSMSWFCYTTGFVLLWREEN